MQPDERAGPPQAGGRLRADRPRVQPGALPGDEGNSGCLRRGRLVPGAVAQAVRRGPDGPDVRGRGARHQGRRQRQDFSRERQGDRRPERLDPSPRSLRRDRSRTLTRPFARSDRFGGVSSLSFRGSEPHRPSRDPGGRRAIVPRLWDVGRWLRDGSPVWPHDHFHPPCPCADPRGARMGGVAQRPEPSGRRRLGS